MAFRVIYEDSLGSLVLIWSMTFTIIYNMICKANNSSHIVSANASDLYLYMSLIYLVCYVYCKKWHFFDMALSPVLHLTFLFVM